MNVRLELELPNHIVLWLPVDYHSKRGQGVSQVLNLNKKLDDESGLNPSD
jgi:hypothetical protein